METEQYAGIAPLFSGNCIIEKMQGTAEEYIDTV
jgi:hypothetical protein